MSAKIVAHPRQKAARMLANAPDLTGVSIAQLAAGRERWEAACRGLGNDDYTIDHVADVVT
jgi:hypothetical protein